jgi:membrane fusion protein, multidrug efflux system
MIPTDSKGSGNKPAALESDKAGTHFGEPGTRPAITPVPAKAGEPEHVSAKVTEPKWQKWAAPLAVVLLAAGVVFTITRNWNAWAGNRIEQVTDDAYVWGDITPLSTKVDGIVQDVKVSDFQTVHKGDILVELENKDFLAQAAQADAAVAAAKAAIDENRRDRELQDSVISKALTGVDQTNDQIVAAKDAIEAAKADVVRAEKERRRQEALFQTQSTTRQTLEQAVDAAQSAAAQLASRDAELAQAKALLASSELAVEAERRNKVVLESQEVQLIADLHAKEDALTLAQIDLGYTKIAAPADGAVGERQVRQGQFVSPGTEVIPFVDRVKWVQANYLETQLTHVRVGDPAEIRIDEYPGRVFHGKVIEISPASGSQFALLPPDNATGNFTKVVQRIPVKISLDDPVIATDLAPGLSVEATVRTSH